MVVNCIIVCASARRFTFLHVRKRTSVLFLFPRSHFLFSGHIQSALYQLLVTSILGLKSVEIWIEHKPTHIEEASLYTKV